MNVESAPAPSDQLLGPQPRDERNGATDEESYPDFERTADELAARIPFLLDLIEHDLSTQEVTTR